VVFYIYTREGHGNGKRNSDKSCLGTQAMPYRYGIMMF
jgi:hypothetical protein